MSVIELRATSCKDPDGRHFRKLLQAMEKVQRFGALRSVAVHGLAVLGVFLWLLQITGRFPAVVQDLTMLAFFGTGLCAIVAFILECRWQQVQRECMKETDARVLDGDDPDDAQRR